MVGRIQAVAWAAGVVALAMAAGTPAVVEWARPLHDAVRVPVVLAFMGGWAALVAIASACLKEARLRRPGTAAEGLAGPAREDGR
ncbi:hypothetical protein [Geochorda subterranea]|uniref:Uncharacterized protein n=1 Tax=Geochorda subterranea TaxID=3109564 RepID=A0ABZ1BS95_9FIRM|nr:hypothetical protein [Limnochorda sp. LNt]WRP15599.1 hypothetical protein VLY81_05400 [Limnochorda sp. LNt]